MRNWFITGVSSGLGRSLAMAALNRGDRVAGTLRKLSQAEAFEALAPGRARAVLLDVTDQSGIAQAVAEVEEVFGSIGILVNNAGSSLIGTIEETGLEAVRALLEVNFFGPLAIMKTVMPGMRRRRSGVIVNVSSMAGLCSGAGMGAYGASKLALEAVSQAARQELSQFNIRTMAVIPGAFRTELGIWRVMIPTTIVEYAKANEERVIQLDRLTGAQRGDPAKAASAIIAAVDSADPPASLSWDRTHWQGYVPQWPYWKRTSVHGKP